MAMTLKNKLFDYLAIRHLNLMPPEVKERFEDYIKNGDFQGQMKSWLDDKHKLYGVENPDFGPATGGATNPYELSIAEWDELYDSCQKTFQAMNEAKDPSVGIKRGDNYNKATLDFIAEFFGNDTKTFTTTTASTEAENTLNKIANILDPRGTGGIVLDAGGDARIQYAAFKTCFQNSPSLKEVFSDGLDFDGFIKGLREKKYNTDLKFRKKVETVAYHIKEYLPQVGYQAPDKREWPENIGYTAHPENGIPVVDSRSTHLDSFDREEANPYNTTAPWFKLKNRTAHLERFKKDWPKIFDTLLTKKKIRDAFTEAAQDNVVTEPLQNAIGQTDYDNTESKNYIPEKYDDEKNWRQIIEDKLDDLYEDYFRKFTNPTRGTRIFFSPWSQNIIKAFDKVKLKPTDGLAGILDKQGDIVKKLSTSPTSKSHFEWFAKKLEFLKSNMSKAFEGALSNGSQLRALVAALINEAVEEGKIDEAYTALEVLSVAKYGLLCSRTFNRLRDATKDMKVLSDDKLSWNKNEGIQFVTKAVDATARAAIVGAGAIFTIARNAYQHSNTKFKNDISKHKKLNDAYKNKQNELDKAHDDLRASNAAHNVTQNLTDLNNATRVPVTHNPPQPGDTAFKTSVQINQASIETVKTNLQNAKNAGATTVAPYGCAVEDLQNDIDLYNDAYDRQQKDEKWDENNSNPYDKLIAYWDMLESVGKSHSFTLGSMSAKRKANIAEWIGDNKKQKINALVADYGAIRTAA